MKEAALIIRTLILTLHIRHSSQNHIVGATTKTQAWKDGRRSSRFPDIDPCDVSALATGGHGVWQAPRIGHRRCTLPSIGCGGFPRLCRERIRHGWLLRWQCYQALLHPEASRHPNIQNPFLTRRSRTGTSLARWVILPSPERLSAGGRRESEGFYVGLAPQGPSPANHQWSQAECQHAAKPTVYFPRTPPSVACLSVSQRLDTRCLLFTRQLLLTVLRPHAQFAICDLYLLERNWNWKTICSWMTGWGRSRGCFCEILY